MKIFAELASTSGRRVGYTEADIDRIKKAGARELYERGCPVKLIARHYRVSARTIYGWLAEEPAE